MDEKLSKMLDEVEAMYPAEEYPEVADAVDALNSAISAAEGGEVEEEPELDLEEEEAPADMGLGAEPELDMEDEEEGMY